MAKKSLLDKHNGNINLDNSFINQKQKQQNLPETSLRIKGDTHSKITVLKKVEMTESLSEILDKALDDYVKKLPKEKQKEIQELVETENEYKLRKERNKANKR
ncbi:hypothetical protein ACHM05_06565 [Staphylococcus aureus]|uniref:hypothetical protein n=1 Tax=Staphylococcus aureus TaxID=1280 RepID=UPI003771C782